jgi:hypothetical protein
MSGDLRSELGAKSEILSGGDGHNNSLWTARIADGVMQAGVDVSIPKPELGMSSQFHMAEMNKMLRGENVVSHGAQPAPELATPPEPQRDSTPKPQGATMG